MDVYNFMDVLNKKSILLIKQMNLINFVNDDDLKQRALDVLADAQKKCSGQKKTEKEIREIIGEDLISQILENINMQLRELNGEDLEDIIHSIIYANRSQLSQIFQIVDKDFIRKIIDYVDQTTDQNSQEIFDILLTLNDEQLKDELKQKIISRLGIELDLHMLVSLVRNQDEIKDIFNEEELKQILENIYKSLCTAQNEYDLDDIEYGILKYISIGKLIEDKKHLEQVFQNVDSLIENSYRKYYKDKFSEEEIKKKLAIAKLRILYELDDELKKIYEQRVKELLPERYFVWEEATRRPDFLKEQRENIDDLEPIGLPKELTIGVEIEANSEKLRDYDFKGFLFRKIFRIRKWIKMAYRE